MRHVVRANVWARLFLTLGALLPYWRLLTLNVIYITDDYFTSDIFNGEFPGRVLVGQLIRRGELPLWTTQLCSGLPLAGAPMDPLGLLAFGFLPPASALDLFVIVQLMIAAHGAYGLARRVGADRTSAVLAGLAFAGSGYIASQLKHLAIVATIVWLPAGLVLIDRAFDASAKRSRGLALATFGVVFAQQVLAGFPQSAYICALVYGSFALFKAWQSVPRPPTWRHSLTTLAGLGAATLLGAAAGAVVVLPLAELASNADRATHRTWLWATTPGYWVPNILTFVLPYINGDISNNTYGGDGLFWEDYGYVGLATFLLALYAVYREWRRPNVTFFLAATVAAYLLVLGAATPVYGAAYVLLPGLSQFRFPTRFLVVVQLGLAVLGALGLSRLTRDVVDRFGTSRARLAQIAVCGLTALDLLVHQPRQNPMVAADPWLTAPATVSIIHGDHPEPRTLTPDHRLLHHRTFRRASGWADVSPVLRHPRRPPT